MRKLLIIALFIPLFISFNCEMEEPESIFKWDATAKPDPVITSVEPPDSAYGGADRRFTVTIVGEDFGDNAAEIFVNFGSKLAEIVEFSTTQLVVTPPANFLDSLQIQISKSGSNAAYGFGVYLQSNGDYHPYKLKNPVSQITYFDKSTPPEGICVDGNENLFVTHGQIIEKVSPSGVVTTVGQLRGKLTNNIQVGPDGALYYVYSKNVMKVDTATYSVHTYKKLSNTAKDLDFDINDNLYAIDEKAIYSVDITTMEPTELVSFQDTTFSCMRIYNDELYIVGKYAGADTTISEGPYIWKYVWKYALGVNSGILSGDLQEVFNWSMSFFPQPVITNITFSSTGELFVGTEKYSLLEIKPNGTDYATGEVFQVYNQIISTELAFRIFWGTGDYLYMSTNNALNPDKTKLLKMNMFGTGSAYFGRD
jgi:hypothetical protein